MRGIKIGDVFEIPLSNSQVAYGQYLFQSKLGPLIQVFDIFSVPAGNISQIVSARELFPPIIVGLFAAIKVKLWKVIGNSSVENFVHPIFISTEWDKNGNATFWHSWDGEKYFKIGKQLPDKYKDKEFLIIYPAPMVSERIEMGKAPYPYFDLIQNNRFTPLE